MRASCLVHRRKIRVIESGQRIFEENIVGTKEKKRQEKGADMKDALQSIVRLTMGVDHEMYLVTLPPCPTNRCRGYDCLGCDILSVISLLHRLDQQLWASRRG